MNCPICENKSKTIDSRPMQNNITRRRRECKLCKERWTTYEIDSITFDVLDEFKDYTDKLIELYDSKHSLLTRR